MSDICPLCEKSKIKKIEDNDVETDLCNSCHDNRFFNDDQREVEYRNIVKTRVEELEKLFKNDYNENLHLDMVQQMVRCEIAIHRYEQLIANDDESATTSEYLKAERSHWNKLAEKLHVTIKSFRGDVNIHKHDMSDDFKTYFQQMLEQVGEKKNTVTIPVEEYVEMTRGQMISKSMKEKHAKRKKEEAERKKHG